MLNVNLNTSLVMVNVNQLTGFQLLLLQVIFSYNSNMYTYIQNVTDSNSSILLCMTSFSHFSLNLVLPGLKRNQRTTNIFNYSRWFQIEGIHKNYSPPTPFDSQRDTGKDLNFGLEEEYVNTYKCHKWNAASLFRQKQFQLINF